MKVFVWNYVSNLTGNFHSGGGLVVFAETVERAKQLALEHGVVQIANDEIPDDVRIVEGVEAVYIMQDAGCC